MSNIFDRDFGRPQTNGFVPNLYGNGGGSPVVSTNPNATYARPVPKSQRALYGGGSGNIILNSTPQSPGTTMTTSSSNNASSNHNLYR